MAAKKPAVFNVILTFAHHDQEHYDFPVDAALAASDVNVLKKALSKAGKLAVDLIKVSIAPVGRMPKTWFDGSKHAREFHFGPNKLHGFDRGL